MFPTFNQNNNSFNSNTLLNRNNEQAHQTFIKQMISYIEQCQKSSQVQWPMNILNTEYQQMLEHLDQMAKGEDQILYDQQFNKEVRERCLKIKKDNDLIMISLFNFKENMMKIGANPVDKDISKENQYKLVQEKIRRLKMEISNKLQTIKANRKSKKSKPSLSQPSRFRRVSKIPARLVLTELKDAVQVVNKQLIKQREEIKELIKLLYDEDI